MKYTPRSEVIFKELNLSLPSFVIIQCTVSCTLFRFLSTVRQLPTRGTRGELGSWGHTIHTVHNVCEVHFDVDCLDGAHSVHTVQVHIYTPYCTQCAHCKIVQSIHTVHNIQPLHNVHIKIQYCEGLFAHIVYNAMYMMHSFVKNLFIIFYINTF